MMRWVLLVIGEVMLIWGAMGFVVASAVSSAELRAKIATSRPGDAKIVKALIWCALGIPLIIWAAR